MRKYKRVIFVAGNGITRAPMAAEIYKTLEQDETEVLARGLLVAFPEPLNQKTEAIMISNGINVTDYQAKELSDSEITEDSIIFVMEESQRKKVLDRYEHATEENTYVLTSFVDEELEIIDPYGGPLQTYGICFEMLKSTMIKVVEKLDGEN